MRKVYKVLSLLLKWYADLFVWVFSKSRHYFVLDLGKGSNQKLYSLANYANSSEYEQYQKRKTSRRIATGYDDSWCTEETISLISSYLVRKNGDRNFKGICHGSRVGKEVGWFNHHLPTGSHVFGTDIEASATKFANTIEHDFHEVKNEWLNSFDFIYSNSHDHAKDPKKALKNWLLSIHDEGFLFLEHCRSHGKKYQDNIDCWGIESEILPFLLLQWFKGEIVIVDMIPINESNAHYIFVLARQRQNG
jgi:hypothetical protein